MPRIYKPRQFCPKGHDMFIGGKHINGHCKICTISPKKQFCLRGHDTFICGRDKGNGCIQCRREKDVRRKKKLRAEGNTKLLKEIAKRAYEKNSAHYIEAAIKWAIDNPDKAHFIARKSRLKRFYKLTLEMYEEILKIQHNKCAICDNPFLDLMFDPHVDHDHKCCPGKKSCGKCVRGLLCLTCNFALGTLQDNIPSLERAISYLKSHQINIP